jgi:hypothetical protein
MAFTTRLLYENIRSLDTATAGTIKALGTPLANPASLIKMVNLSNKNLLISIDGTNNVDICAANGFWLYDVTSDSPTNNNIFVDKGRQYYVTTSDGAAGTGLVYLVVQYILVN